MEIAKEVEITSLVRLNAEEARAIFSAVLAAIRSLDPRLVKDTPSDLIQSLDSVLDKIGDVVFTLDGVHEALDSVLCPTPQKEGE